MNNIILTLLTIAAISAIGVNIWLDYKQYRAEKRRQEAGK